MAMFQKKQMVSLPEFTMYRSEKLVDQGRNLRGNQCIGLSWTILDMACLRTSSGKLSPWYSWVYITMFHNMEQNIFHFKNLSQQKLTFWEFKSFMEFDVEKPWKKTSFFGEMSQLKSTLGLSNRKLDWSIKLMSTSANWRILGKWYSRCPVEETWLITVTINGYIITVNSWWSYG